MLKKKYIRACCQTFISILRILKYTRIKSCHRLVKMQQKQDCLVVGNGPSMAHALDKQDFMAGKDCICVNNVANHEMFMLLKPKYYVILDPVFFQRELSDSFKDIQNTLLQSLTEKTSWPMQLYCPNQAANNKELFKNLTCNKNIEVNYFNTTAVNGFKSFARICYKYNIGMPQAQNVLVAALYVALNLGYKQIYITGGDHSWHEEIVMSDNVVCLRDKHFYDAKAFAKPWVKDIISGETWKMHEILFALGQMFAGYHVIKDYAEYLNAKIYNASYQSYIDAFPRFKL